MVRSTLHTRATTDGSRGAGGKNADLTSSLVEVCQASIGIDTVMHLCCTESEYSYT